MGDERRHQRQPQAHQERKDPPRGNRHPLPERQPDHGRHHGHDHHDPGDLLPEETEELVSLIADRADQVLVQAAHLDVAVHLEILVNLLPFGYTAQFPVNIINGRFGWGRIGVGIAFQIGWIFFFACLGNIMWRRGLKRYAAVGG